MRAPRGRLYEGQFLDGASKRNLGPSGAGYVARDNRGNIQMLGAKRLSVRTNSEADGQAASLAIKMAIKMQVNFI